MKKEWSPSEAQLVCRDLRHVWSPFDAWKEGRNYIRVLRCTRCGSQRIQTLDNQGYVMDNRMKYSSGYVRKDGGRMTQDEVAFIRQFNTERTLNNIAREKRNQDND